jgi:Epoxide hydrolase N terminus
MTATDLTIRPFEVRVPDEDLAELRRRIAAVRWPSTELVADRSQGVQLATIRELARYWITEYHWRACERSSAPRAAGSRSSTPISSTFTRPTGAATSRPGKSRSCFPKRSARASGRSAR